MGIVPGDAATLDQNGNMSAGQIVQIMSWFKAFGEQGYQANMRDGGRRLARDNKRPAPAGLLISRFKKSMGSCYRAFISASTSAHGAALLSL